MEWLLCFVLFSPLVTAVLCGCMRSARALWTVALCGSVATLVGGVSLMWCMPSVAVGLPLVFADGIGFVSHPVGLLLSAVACVMWFVSVVVAKEYFSHTKRPLRLYYVSLFVVQTGCLGVFLAADLKTLYLFFELMSLVSVVWVAQDRTQAGVKATVCYLSYAVAGGMSLLFGLFLLSANGVELSIPLGEVGTGQTRILGVIFVMVGFGMKAGLFFLHDWLPLAHTVSPAPASALLSGMLTKTGVYGSLVVLVEMTPQGDVFAVFLLLLATLTLFIGGLCALWAGNLKRVLAYSTVSQIGFLMWGVSLIVLCGVERSIAVYGFIFHLVTHSLVKSLLFSAAGVIYQNTGTLELDGLQGFGRGKPWLHGLFLVGALSLSGIPLGAAYASKSLLHEAMVEYLHLADAISAFYLLEWVFVVTGGITMAYLARLYLCLFIREGKTQWKKETYATPKTMVCLSVVAVGLLCLGVAPSVTGIALGDYITEQFVAQPLVDVHFFGVSHLKYAVIGVAVACGILWWTYHKKQRGFEENSILCDTVLERIYYPIMGVVGIIFAVVARLLDSLIDVILSHIWQGWCKPLEIPDTFEHGDENLRKHIPTEFHLSSSLSYSLLMFGFGFLFTIVYLLVVGGS